MLHGIHRCEHDKLRKAAKTPYLAWPRLVTWTNPFLVAWIGSFLMNSWQWIPNLALKHVKCIHRSKLCTSNSGAQELSSWESAQKVSRNNSAKWLHLTFTVTTQSEVLPQGQSGQFEWCCINKHHITTEELRIKCGPGQCVSSSYETLHRPKEHLNCWQCPPPTGITSPASPLCCNEIIPTFAKYIQICH